ncbi:MAG: hypothetical protein QMD23_02575 [Candidatus Bathyarchaeia archaeon]|nr:hypothetical protein [Candidatus Bathyarchaeia archaeon]
MADVGQLEIQLQHDWLLITYDIPRTQDKERKRIIRALKNMGALMHTESVYYLPANPKAVEIARTLPGQSFVWRSSLTSDSQAKKLTQNYYTQIVEGIDKLDKRLHELQQNWLALSLEAKKQRLEYSVELFKQLEAAANNLGLTVYERLAHVGQVLDTLKEQFWGVTNRWLSGNLKI